MNDTAIKNYAIWARRELIAEVGKRCAYYGILEQGSPDASVDVINGRVLTAAEKRQRADLLGMMERDGYEQLVERAAYTWFNRLLAIRFMEVNDRLSSHVRVLSAPDGSFKPQALAEAMDLPLEALDRDRAVELVQEGDDEALFRLVFLAQCDELAACMPAVFERVGGAMELLLPDGLLRTGGVVEQLVTAIPEEDWTEGVEIVGWMYQYYVSERKDAVFASFKKGKKAEREAIAPATQLFTPNWIVRYLTENSLGRLWVLNHPESDLPSHMPYFVKPDEDAETEFRRISSPEEITVVDPACGSGHILVYAFELLARMYAEAGYSDRDAARLILEKNVSGMEIDPRAAAMASFCLTMKACELDSRFLRRGVSPRVTVLGRVEFESEERALLRQVHNDLDLLDAAAHLDECGSLFKPTREQLAAIARDLASLANDGSLFAGRAREKLEQLQIELEPLAARYDVVVANPPYMGSSNMNKWVTNWVKENYPNSKRDLCTCFIERGFDMLSEYGYSAMVTMESWMFLSSFESMRKNILNNHRIAAMVYMNHMVMRIAFNTCATIFANHHSNESGLYTKVEHQDLNDKGVPFEFPVKRHAPKHIDGALEALANRDCGWFYRKASGSFASIPGSPIAYWVSEGMLRAFASLPQMAQTASPKQGLATGDNDLFIRQWWEVSSDDIGYDLPNRKAAQESKLKWFPCNKGGGYRKWFGNNELVVNWEDDGAEIKGLVRNGKQASRPQNMDWYFKEGMTWGTISSSDLSMRYCPQGFMFETKGSMCFTDSHKDLMFCLAFTNSSLVKELQKILSPTLDYHEGPMGKLPLSIKRQDEVTSIAEEVVPLVKIDWDAFETSWDFKKHPLI